MLETSIDLRASVATLARSPHWKRNIEIEDISPVSHSPAGWWERIGSGRGAA